MNKTRFTLLSLLLIVSITLSACGKSGPKEPGKGDVIVYVAAPLSGFQANGGQTVVGGARLKADEINEQGGLMGYRVVVRAMDDESDSDVAVAVAEEIAAAVRGGERVLGVIGHYNSGQTAAAMEIYKDLPIVVITPTASDMALTEKGYSNFFRVNAHNAAQARTAADFMINKLGVKRVAVLYNDDDYGIDLGQRAASEITALGAEVVSTRQVAVEQNQFQVEVAAIRDSGADGLFYAGYEIECPYLRYDLRAAGLGDMPFLASDGCFLSYTINPPEDVIDQGMKDVSEGIYVLGFAPEPEAVAGANWIKGYQEVEYRNPDTYSVNGYAAMEVLLEGAQKAGNFNGADVARAIRELDFKSLIGQIDYQDNGDLKEQRFFIFQVQNGEFKQVAP